MPTPIPTLKAALMAIGLLWTSASLAEVQEPAPPEPATTPTAAPMPAAQAPSNAPAFAVLLLSNGREIQGEVSPDKAGTHYLLHAKGGTIPIPRSSVAKRYGSVAELYRDKVTHLPEGDVDPLMKLVRWCLEKGLNAEARVHLKAILEISPDDALAGRMLASLDTTTERAASGRDGEVRVTAGTADAMAPRELNASALPASKPRLDLPRSVGPPVVFDLPPGLAIKRASEYGRFVHPVLQAACATCHNDSYRGDFRLIQVKGRRELTTEVVLANLDASLRRVNRDDPGQSDLIGYATTPHGPNTRPIFLGPNDSRYRTLLTWLVSLKATDGGAPAPGLSPMPGTPAPAEQFGSERGGVRGDGSTPPLPSSTANPAPALPTGKRMIDFREATGVDPRVPPGTSFPAGVVPGGPLPSLPARAGGGMVAGVPPGPLPAIRGVNPLPAIPPGTPMPPSDDVIPPTNRAKKKSAIDRAALEGLLKARQGAATPQP